MKPEGSLENASTLLSVVMNLWSLSPIEMARRDLRAKALASMSSTLGSSRTSILDLSKASVPTYLTLGARRFLIPERQKALRSILTKLSARTVSRLRQFEKASSPTLVTVGMLIVSRPEFEKVRELTSVRLSKVTDLRAWQSVKASPSMVVASGALIES